MKQPIVSASWPESWRSSCHFDLLEVFGDRSDLGYTYAYVERATRTLAAIRNVAPPPAKVLDIAGGQGNFSLTLAESGYDVTWNDLREDLVDYIKMKYERGIVAYAPGNCFDLTFDEPFDVVLIAEVIEHVAHPDAFLRQIAGLVRPGGHIVMTTPNGRYFRNALPKFSDCVDASRFEAQQFKPDADGHIFLLHPDEVHQLGVAAGLVLESVELFTNPLTRGALGTGPLLRHIPRRAIHGLERITSLARGARLSSFNMHTLAVFQKPVATSR